MPGMPSDPYSAVISAGIGAVAQIATPAPAGPSEAKSGSVGGASLDNSGWNVTFGANSGVSTARTQSAPTTSLSGALPDLGGLAQYMPYMLAFGALLIWKRSKK